MEGILPINFNDIGLLKQALTHPSLRSKGPDYERMEFLGDHVLGLVVSEELYRKYPNEDEGHLTKRLAGLICGDSLAKIAEKLGLGQHLLMASSEEHGGGRENKANLENAMEAVIAAIYLDQGLEVSRKFILENWGDMLDEMVEPPKDAKSALQEWAQARSLPLPQYEVVSQDGPSHAPLFEVKVSVENNGSEVGKGTSKRIAEQEAAGKLLENISQK